MKSNRSEMYMQRCLDLAIQGWRDTGTNPVVGAVLIYQDRIIGEGYHQKYGEAHAEVNCINSVSKSDKKLISSSELFISLEPCSYQGKTPACTELIVKNKIPKVTVACLDPNPKVSGSGITFLKENNVDVRLGVLQNEAEVLLRKFVINILENLPFIALKWAQSRHGYVGLKDEQIWLSNKYSKVMAHSLRSKFEAILIGTNTAIVDNPELTNRLAPGKTPSRVVLDRNERIPKQNFILDDSVRTIIVTSRSSYILNTTENTSLLIVNEQEWSWSYIFQQLFDLGLSSILIEGGPTVHKSIYNEGLWDEAHVLSSKHPLDHGLRALCLAGRRYESISLGSDRYDHILRN